ncbi:MAG: protein translocase subunit SecF [Pseudomonadota bacterium]
MEFFRPNTNIDFVGKQKHALTFSAILILITIISLIVHKGPRYGVDFAGGIVVQVKFSKPVTAEEIKEHLKPVNLQDSAVQEFEEKGQNEFLIQSSKENIDIENIQQVVSQALSKGFGEKSFEVRRVESVGPKVGKDLRKKGLLAVIFSWLLMLVYVAFRFEFSFGVGGIIALAHDVLVTIGAFSLTNKEIDLTIVAALLTIIGFSINDTIVIFDRVRENRRKKPYESLSNLLNRSINDTLSRTILTTGTVLMGVLTLLIFGGGVIHDFAYAMLVGCISGTYSTLYIASPFVLFWDSHTSKKRGKR